MEKNKPMQLNIDSKEQISLDGNLLRRITKYTLTHTAGEVSELTITLDVTIGQVGFESK